MLCGTVFLEGLDVSMMGVALPSMRADLDLSTSALQWVVSAYVLGYGGFVLLGGRAADLFGRRRMFLLWLAVFIGFSGLGGLATDGWMLILARFVTGVSAGFLTPASLSIITTSFAAGEIRNRALLVYGGVGAGGFLARHGGRGLLTTAGWRWVFRSTRRRSSPAGAAPRRTWSCGSRTSARPTAHNHRLERGEHLAAPLGSIDANANPVTADAVFGSTGTASTMTMSGSTITITLGTLSSGTVATGAAAAVAWTPSTTPKDAAGNSLRSWGVTESGSSDADF